MSNPVLGLKWFCFCIVSILILFFFFKMATIYRISFGKVKFFMSKTESVLLIIIVIVAILALLCLAWSVVAWIAS